MFLKKVKNKSNINKADGTITDLANKLLYIDH